MVYLSGLLDQKCDCHLFLRELRVGVNTGVLVPLVQRQMYTILHMTLWQMEDMPILLASPFLSPQL